jgi:hypothetical protein
VSQVSYPGGVLDRPLGAASISFAGRLDRLPMPEAAAIKPSMRPSSVPEGSMND